MDYALIIVLINKDDIIHASMYAYVDESVVSDMAASQLII